MIKTLPIFIVLFLTLNISGQNCEYVTYFQLTDLAKKDLKTEDFRSARINFQLAFEKSVFPLGHDLSFALFTADKLKDHQWAKQIAEKLAKGGVPLRYFAKFKKKKWYKKFESDFPKLIKHFKKEFDAEMRSSFLKILQADFDFNTQYHEWREGKIELTLQELIDGATNIKVSFEEFNDTYGFPNEEYLGYNYIRRKNAIEPYSIHALMVHIYQRGTFLFKEDLEFLVCQGALHSDFVTTLKTIQGFGQSTGIEQEMKARYKIYRRAE